MIFETHMYIIIFKQDIHRKKVQMLVTSSAVHNSIHESN